MNDSAGVTSPSERAAASARPRARPVPGRRPPGALPLARFGAHATPRGAKRIVEAKRSGALSEIARSRRTLLVTFRRDGRAVPTPVWAAEQDGRLYVRSERASGKIKRLHRDARVLVAPCTVRGVPLGAPLEACARVLPAEQEVLAERVLAARYGLGRALFELGVDLMRVDMCYLEIVPGPWPAPAASGPAA